MLITNGQFMSRFTILFLSAFLVACGSGGGDGGSNNIATPVSGATVSSKYLGQTTQATLHQDNVDDFAQVLFTPINVTSPVLRAEDNDASEITQLQLTNQQVDQRILKTANARLKQSNNLAARAVSFVDYDSCPYGGSVPVTGDLDEATLTGTLYMNFTDCNDGETAMNGLVTLVIYQYNQNYQSMEHFSVSYEDLYVESTQGTYTTSASGVAVVDFINQTVTSTQTAHSRFADKEILFEDYVTVQNSLGDYTIEGKLYLSDHGYVYVSTTAPFGPNSNRGYPEYGGPLVFAGANQTVNLTPKEYGSYLEGQMLDSDQAMTTVLVGNSLPFVNTSYNSGTLYGDLDSITFGFYLSEALDTSRSTLSDLKLIEAGGSTIPADVSYDSNTTLVTITPTAALKHSTQYSFSLEGEWYSVFGKTLELNQNISNMTGPDQTAPVIVSVTPDPETTATLASDRPSFVIEFDEAINPEAITSDDQFLRLEGENSWNYVWVPTTATASGNTLTITPNEPLSYGETYTLMLSQAYFSNIEDVYGNSAWFSSDTAWSYQSELYAQRIDLGAGLSYFDIDKSTNTLYGLDQINKELVLIDLTTDSVTSRHSLLRKPSQLCIHAPSDRLYVTTSNDSYIEEFKLSDLSLVASIGWSGGHLNSDDAPHYDIQCTADKLYVVDADWYSQVYSIERAAPYVETKLDALSSVGDILVTDAGDIYTTIQLGWYSTADVDGYRRYQQDANNDWMLIDEDSLNGYTDRPANLESPLFLDETNNRLISNQYVFNSLNLNHVVHDFGEGVTVLDVDFGNNLIATNGLLYSIETYNQVMTLPVKNIDRAMFDNEGDLYMLKNADSSLYYTKQSEMPE